MDVSARIKELCFRLGISIAELARLLNVSPQALHGKLKRESFTIMELKNIAEVTGCSFEYKFILPQEDTL